MKDIGGSGPGGASDASLSDRVAAAVASAERAASPFEAFGAVDDDVWLWLHTEGYRSRPSVRSLLPKLPGHEEQYRTTGRRGDTTLEPALRTYLVVREAAVRYGTGITDTTDLLDFGCGWGRVTRFFIKDILPGHLWGAEYRDDLVEFCREANLRASVVASPELPPLPFDDARFDIALAFSVFTHFAEEHHRRWLAEIHRVLRPGGLLVATVRHRSFIAHCARLRRGEVAPGTYQPVLAGMFPDVGTLDAFDRGEYCFTPYPGRAWWGEACIPEPYIHRTWAEEFDVLEVGPFAPRSTQIIVVLRRRGRAERPAR